MTDCSGDFFNEACSPCSLCAENEGGEVVVRHYFPEELSVQQGGSRSLDQRSLKPKTSIQVVSRKPFMCSTDEPQSSCFLIVCVA